MRKINHLEAAPLWDACMGKEGVFLNVGGEKPNTMTISWGFHGVMWGKPMIVTMVRNTRFSYEPLIKAGEFTISVPTKNPLKEELVFAGTKSGRDLDKFSGHGLTAVPAIEVAAPIIAECGLHFECVLRHTQQMTEENVGAFGMNFYPEKDFHTLFFGEIVECYFSDL